MKPYINISKRKDKTDTYQFTIKNSWFKDTFTYEIYEDKLVFNRTNICYEGRSYRATETNYGWYGFQLANENFKVGSFYIDEEESNEDTIVLYYEDIREI